MVGLRSLGFAAAVTVAVTAANPALAYWGGYGYRGYGYGGPFGPGPALGGFYGGYYPRPYAYPAPYYLPPPVIYAPPVFLPPPIYAVPPRRRAIVHRLRSARVIPQCRCVQPMPTNVPAVLRDVPSPGP